MYCFGLVMKLIGTPVMSLEVLWKADGLRPAAKRFIGVKLCCKVLALDKWLLADGLNGILSMSWLTGEWSMQTHWLGARTPTIFAPVVVWSK